MTISESHLRASFTMTTFSGRMVPLLDPKPEHISLDDIGHSLALQCRYNGHIRTPWSVAQHSLACINEAKRRGLTVELQFACLMHDAAEAYVGDLIYPLKMAVKAQGITFFDDVEKRFTRAIAEFCGLSPAFDQQPEVVAVDQAVCAREMLEFRTMPEGWTPHVEPAAKESLTEAKLTPGWVGARCDFIEAAEPMRKR